MAAWLALEWTREAGGPEVVVIQAQVPASLGPRVDTGSGGPGAGGATVPVRAAPEWIQAGEQGRPGEEVKCGS